MSEELNDHVSEAPHPHGVIKSKIPAGTPALAPDGLPWPEGYFEKPPRVSIEAATRRNGVRPRIYRGGHPVYEQQDRDDPNYVRPPDESAWAAELIELAEKREREAKRMALQPLDVIAAQVAYKNCNDIRPCVVIYPPSDGTVSVALISSQLGMFDENEHLMIEMDDPDFQATGLNRASYVSLGMQTIKLD